jgi:hypothetical protein
MTGIVADRRAKTGWGTFWPNGLETIAAASLSVAPPAGPGVFTAKPLGEGTFRLA